MTARVLIQCFAMMALVPCSAQLFAETKHALLVGCTEYKSLPANKQLGGPENDVKLFRDILIDRFGFNPECDKITVLTASLDREHQPTKANIKREFTKLAETVKEDERVVILLGGHGSQEPDDDPDNPSDHEPDGYDETFLPCDIGEWNPRVGVVENSIRDDELRVWLGKILQCQAKVWMIVDACHSGSGIRGQDSETLRQVPPEFLIPKRSLTTAKQSVAENHAMDDPESLFDGPGELVVIYAAQPHEPTVERRLPRGVDAGSQKMHGLLTFTLCDIINQLKGKLTYNQLVEAIQTRYVLMGKREPTPLIEGNACDQLVLGQQSFSSRSSFRLRKGFSSEPLTLDAGAFDGVTKGSVLAVSPPLIDSGEDAAVVGYVRVVKPDLTQSVVEPCEFSGTKAIANSKFTNHSRCQLVHRQLNENRLQLGVDVRNANGQSVSEPDRQSMLTALRSCPQPMVHVVDDVDDVAWFVRLDNHQAFLVPSGGVSKDQVKAMTTIERTEGWPNLLMKKCGQIARAESLLRLSEIGSHTVDGEVLGLQLRVLADGSIVPWKSDGRTMTDGQRVVVEIQNTSHEGVDVTVLYVDSNYGITCLYPRIGEYNRLAAGDIDRIKLTVSAETTGIENIVVIGKRAAGLPKSYRFLEQPGFASDRGSDGSTDPLSQLCEYAVFGGGKTRGISEEQARDYQVSVLTWRVIASE
ncbi:caspase family protein [Rhodopirellula sp. SWK7]|uniref:caspase family protein n=1 Tax=Rhodopirellula sp. SWK7 TaxID=595460 RepID=UPI0002BDB2D4|nr:caspase family protein [Rhodopirellula sp. SWK7]EMI44944.1 peptidase C14 caspase catalytic subunit p20 [Rhodopirellula sp. SWK7]